MTICILDTSVLCELLNVPGKSSRHSRATSEFASKSGQGEEFVLPLTAVIETGNHIAQNGEGRQRRAVAKKFVELVTKAIDGESPFAITPVPYLDSVREWLDSFVEDATQGWGLETGASSPSGKNSASFTRDLDGGSTSGPTTIISRATTRELRTSGPSSPSPLVCMPGSVNT